MMAVPLGAPWLRCQVEVPHCCDPQAAYFDKNLPCAPWVTYSGAQRSEVWPALHDKSCMSHCGSCEEASLSGSRAWMASRCPTEAKCIAEAAAAAAAAVGAQAADHPGDTTYCWI